MEKAERRALIGFVLVSWIALGVRAGFWYAERRTYVAMEGQVPVGWLLTALDVAPIAYVQQQHSKKRAQLSPQPQQSRLVVLDLNTLDSAALEALPYIGPVLASRICRFRHALGGYHTVQQLREVWGLHPDACERLIPMFDTGSGVYRPLCADTSSWYELKSHPYIDAAQASAIERYRRHHVLDSLEDLVAAIPITDSMIRRWSPYLRLCE